MKFTSKKQALLAELNVLATMLDKSNKQYDELLAYANDAILLLESDSDNLSKLTTDAVDMSIDIIKLCIIY